MKALLTMLVVFLIVLGLCILLDASKTLTWILPVASLLVTGACFFVSKRLLDDDEEEDGGEE